MFFENEPSVSNGYRDEPSPENHEDVYIWNLIMDKTVDEGVVESRLETQQVDFGDEFGVILTMEAKKRGSDSMMHSASQFKK